MQLNEYRNEFLEDIKARASASADFTHASFVMPKKSAISSRAIFEAAGRKTDRSPSMGTLKIA
jgi:hypothetical protein